MLFWEISIWQIRKYHAEENAHYPPQNRLQPEDVYHRLASFSMTIFRKNGSACFFHDYLQSRQLQNKDFPALLALEQRYCRQEPYISLGRYIHVMAQKCVN